MLGITFGRVACWWKGDGFSVVVTCFKAHLLLFSLTQQNLDYSLYLLEFSSGYAKTEEKIKQYHISLNWNCVLPVLCISNLSFTVSFSLKFGLVLALMSYFCFYLNSIFPPMSHYLYRCLILILLFYTYVLVITHYIFISINCKFNLSFKRKLRFSAKFTLCCEYDFIIFLTNFLIFWTLFQVLMGLFRPKT